MDRASWTPHPPNCLDQTFGLCVERKRHRARFRFFGKWTFWSIRVGACVLYMSLLFQVWRVPDTWHPNDQTSSTWHSINYNPSPFEISRPWQQATCNASLSQHMSLSRCLHAFFSKLTVEIWTFSLIVQENPMCVSHCEFRPNLQVPKQIAMRTKSDRDIVPVLYTKFKA